MSIDLHDRVLRGFADTFGDAPDLVVRAPGRVNLIGEHTDYNDGFALPIAIGAETRIALRRRADGDVHVAALDYAEHDRFTLTSELTKSARGGWRDYVRGTLVVLAAAGIPVVGAELAIAGDIPKGTGLSSSASLEVGIATAMLAAIDRRVDPTQVALWAQAAENDFVGMRCGNLDQIASAATRSGAALLIDCRSLELTPVPLHDDAVVMIVQSGVVRGLVEGEYNARRRECEAAAAALGVPALRDADPAMLVANRSRMDDTVFRRARHIVTDNARTLLAATALRAGDLAEMGRLMRESHASQRDDFGITVPDTDRLAAILDAAIGPQGGARQTGGGFGGAVVALLPRERVAMVRNTVIERYRTAAGHPPDIMIERPADGAAVIG